MAIKNKVFRYEFIDTQTAKKRIGRLEAPSLSGASALLRQRGIVPTKVYREWLLFRSSSGFQAISNKQLTLMTRQLATMAAAGIPLVQSLGILIESTSDERVELAVQDIKTNVEAGLTLSAAMKMHPESFDDLFCNLVGAGEQTGKLDVMFDRVAVYKEKTETLKKKIKKAMFYPIAVLTVAIGVTFLLMIKVVPTFENLFKGFGAELPDFTKLVLHISRVLKDNALVALAIVLMAGFTLLYSYRHFRMFRNRMQVFSLRIPIIGLLLKQAITARFCRTLATSFAAGIPLPDGLESVAKAANNYVYYVATMRVRQEVISGLQLFVALRKTKLFDPLVIQMVSIGEQSGALDQMLSKVANIYEEEVDLKIDALTTLMEPFIMVTLGVIVGGLVIAMYLPIFKMGSVI